MGGDGEQGRGQLEGVKQYIKPPPRFFFSHPTLPPPLLNRPLLSIGMGRVWVSETYEKFVKLKQVTKSKEQKEYAL